MSELLAELKEWGELSEWSKHQIVTVHPHADEEDILQAISMSPDECLDVDMYWLFEGKIYLVQISSSKQVGIIGGVILNVTHVDENENFGGSFSMTTEQAPIYMRTTEEILDKLAAWIVKNPQRIEEIYQLASDPESPWCVGEIMDDIDDYQL